MSTVKSLWPWVPLLCRRLVVLTLELKLEKAGPVMSSLVNLVFYLGWAGTTTNPQPRARAGKQSVATRAREAKQHAYSRRGVQDSGVGAGEVLHVPQCQGSCMPLAETHWPLHASAKRPQASAKRPPEVHYSADCQCHQVAGAARRDRDGHLLRCFLRVYAIPSELPSHVFEFRWGRA